MKKSRYGGDKNGLGLYELMVVPRNIYTNVIDAIEDNRISDFYSLLGLTPQEGRLSHKQNKRILIIEDKLKLAQAVNESLSRRGFNVSYTADKKELSQVQNMGINLIIMDLTFHGADALSLCKRLRENEHTRRIPVIIINGKKDEKDIIAGLEAGADDYIGKEFSLNELAARVKAVLRRYE